MIRPIQTNWRDAVEALPPDLRLRFNRLAEQLQANGLGLAAERLAFEKLTAELDEATPCPACGARHAKNVPVPEI